MSKSSLPRLTASGGSGLAGRQMSLAVPERAWAEAERFAVDYTGRNLEAVVAAFVIDLAAAGERPGSWEKYQLGAWLAGHSWPKRDEELGY